MAGALLRLRGLPFSSDAQAVRDFFASFHCQDVQLLVGRNGKPTGEAYVEFSSPAEAARAMREQQHEHMGSRYIEIFEVPEAEAVALAVAGGAGANSAHAGGSGEGGGEAEDETDAAQQPQPGFSLTGHVLRLRGLPFNSAAQDVLDFLSGLTVLGGEAGILFTCAPDGRPSGEAYLEVASEDDAAAVLGRHKERIGSRYIEVFPSSKGDLLQAVAQQGFFTAVGGRRQHHWQGTHSGGGDRADIHARAGAGMDEMAAAFAGFGLSQRDMQVPGPPRYGSSLGYSYGASPPAMPPPPLHAMGPQGDWRQPLPHTLRTSGPGSMRGGGGGGGQFDPAPGPPKPGRGGLAGGPQPAGTLYDYSGQPTAYMVNPFMMQQPFLMAAPPGQPVSQGGAWAHPAGMLAPQQGGAWYAPAPPPPGPPGRGGMQMGVAAPYGYVPGTGGYGYAQPPPPPGPGMPPPPGGYVGRRAPGPPPPAAGRPRTPVQEQHPSPIPSPIRLERPSSAGGGSDENGAPLQQHDVAAAVAAAAAAMQQNHQRQASPVPAKLVPDGSGRAGGADSSGGGGETPAQEQ